MKIENLAAAAKAAADYRSLLNQIEDFKTMKWFRVSGSTDASLICALSEPVSQDQSGSHGVLAMKLRAAMNDYYDTHKRLAEERLANLGVVVETATTSADR